MNAFPFQWSVDTKNVPRGGLSHFDYEASPEELAALKEYAGIDDLSRFRAKVKIAALAAGRFRVSGELSAHLVQSSVVNLEPVNSSIEEEFAVEYWPEEALAGAEAENLPLNADQPESIFEGRILIGAFLSELFVLALDPYPRNDGDSLEWEPQGLEAEAHPFAALSQFKPRGGEGTG
jgi:hypothetical protein